MQLVWNTLWIGTRTAVRFLPSVIMTLCLVRYLGPELYGTYALVLVAVKLAECVQAMVHPNLVIRDVSRAKDDTETAVVLHTAAAVRSLLGLGMWLAIVSADYLLIPAAVLPEIRTGIPIASLTLLCGALPVYQAFFLGRLNSRPLAIIEIAVSLATAAAIAVGMAMGAGLPYFFWLTPAASLMNLIMVIGAYGATKPPMCFSLGYAKLLLAESWPLFFSTLSMVAYTKVDQFILAIFSSRTELGQYAATVKIAETSDLFGMAIAATALPKLSDIKEKQPDRYNQALQDYFDIAILVWLLSALPLAVLAPHVVQLVYGPEYELAGKLLPVYIWAQFATAVGLCRGTVMTINKLLYLALPITICGAVTNFILNLLWIPRYGAWGATWATLVSYLLVCVAITFFIPSLQFVATLPFRSLNLLRSCQRMFNLIRQKHTSHEQSNL